MNVEEGEDGDIFSTNLLEELFKVLKQIETRDAVSSATAANHFKTKIRNLLTALNELPRTSANNEAETVGLFENIQKTLQEKQSISLFYFNLSLPSRETLEKYKALIKEASNDTLS